VVKFELYGRIQVVVDNGETTVRALDPRNAKLAEAVRASVFAAENAVNDSPSVFDLDKDIADAIEKVSGLGPMTLIAHVLPVHDAKEVY